MAVEAVNFKRALELLRTVGVDNPRLSEVWLKLLNEWERVEDVKTVRTLLRLYFPNIGWKGN